MVKYRGGRSQRILDACRKSRLLGTGNSEQTTNIQVCSSEPREEVNEIEQTVKKAKYNIDELLVNPPLTNEYQTYFNSSAEIPGDGHVVLASVGIDELQMGIYIQDNAANAENLIECEEQSEKIQDSTERREKDQFEASNNEIREQQTKENEKQHNKEIEQETNNYLDNFTNQADINVCGCVEETVQDDIYLTDCEEQSEKIEDSTERREKDHFEASNNEIREQQAKENENQHNKKVEQETNNYLKNFTNQADLNICGSVEETVQDDIYIENSHQSDNSVKGDSGSLNSSNNQEETDCSGVLSSNGKPFAVKNVKQRKMQRNLGKSYSTAKGKTVSARELKPLRENCRNKCKTFLSDNVRQTIFEEYWSLGSHDRRVAFIAGLVGVQEKKITRRKVEGKPTRNRTNTYTYKFCIQGEEQIVCKTCFCNTLSETEKCITCVMQNKLTSTSGVTHEDLRGKHAPPHKTPQYKINDVKRHITSFPAYKSHYSRRHTDKNYLSSDLNINTMYKLYCGQYSENPVSITIYTRVFHTLNLKFKKPKNDTCTKCDTLTAKVKYASTDNEKNQFQQELQNHQITADNAYTSKSLDKQKGLQNIKCVTYAFDLQQVLPTPFLTSNKMFYLRQLSTYNLTVHNCINGKSSHFMWPECTASRGSNEIASCLYRFLQGIPEEVEHAIFYSDTCGGQNKNFNVISMFQYAIHLHPSLKIIDHKFLVPGHTHLECDVDHSVIERAKKKSPFEIHVPRDWYQLVRNASKKNNFSVFPMEIEHFYAFSNINNSKGPHQKKAALKLREVSWLRFTKTVTVNYKLSLHDEEPFKEVPALFDGPRPINTLKKQNLLEIVELLDKDVQSYYKNLKVDKKIEKDTDPDIDRYFSDEESE